MTLPLEDRGPNPNKLGILERKMVKAVKAPLGDFRDWDVSRAHADEIGDAPT